jgi:hypothetical protein
MGWRARLLAGPVLVAIGVTSTVVFAQDSGNSGAADSNNPGSSDGVVVDSTGASNDSSGGNVINITTAPGEPSSETTVTSTPPFGFPAPGTDLEGHLPSSSHARSDINQQDGFDLNQGATDAETVKGNANAMGVGLGRRKAAQVPEMHTVRKGDTLWDLCAGYFNNPWMWPKVWSQNAQLQNPHWIYPGDQLRLREPGGDMPTVGQSVTLGSGSGLSVRRATVPRTTVFLRNIGYIDDPDDEIWGELVGAEAPQQLLSEGNKVYLIMRPGVSLRVGQLLTIFAPGRKVQAVPGARMPPGSLVKFKGTVKVTRWDPSKRMATGMLTESLDPIERGAKIGQIGRRFDVVPPKPSVADVSARVLTSMYPHEIMGKDQLLFIDRGSQDGLVAGNRLFVLRRGDTWRHTLSTASNLSRLTMNLDQPEWIPPSETTPLGGEDEDFPIEVVGELRVIRAHKYSSLVLVTASKVEIEPGDQAVTRKGE